MYINETIYNDNGVLRGWNLGREQRSGKVYFICSRCGRIIHNCTKVEINEYKYCSYCGHNKGQGINLGIGD